MQTMQSDGHTFVQISNNTLSLINTLNSCNDLISSFIDATAKMADAYGKLDQDTLSKRLSEFDSHMDSVSNLLALMIGDSISYSLIESHSQSI